MKTEMKILELQQRIKNYQNLKKKPTCLRKEFVDECIEALKGEIQEVKHKSCNMKEGLVRWQ